MKQYVEDVGNGWYRISVNFEVPVYRQGLLGIWDAIRAALKRKPVKTVQQIHTFSFYNKDGTQKTEMMSLEEGKRS